MKNRICFDKSIIGICTLVVFISINAKAASSCDTVESSRSYISGLCPADHQKVEGDQKTAFTYHCEMMANDDFIINEVAKTTTCDSVTATAQPITTAQAAPPNVASRSLAATN